jgi:hypothetical protein
MTMRPARETPAVSIDPDELVARAREIAGDRDGLPLRFLPSLDRLTEAANTEAQLTMIGRRQLHDSLISQLVTQIQAHRLVESHPEIQHAVISAPIMITGMPRTGTTALQNMLASHPDLRAPSLWELMAPATPTGQGQHAMLIELAQRYVDQYYAVAPAFRMLHPLDALRPDECHRLTGTTFRSNIYAQRYRVPSYLAWLRDQDMVEVYQYHRTLLSCLLWRRPGEHVLLKCPSHLWHLDALAAVYPGARVVRLHRDPMTCIPSACNLTSVVRSVSAAEVDKAEIGREWIDYADQGLSRQRRAEESVPGIRILDVRQQDLLVDPLSIVGLVCEFAGIPMTATARARIEHYVGDNPPDKHGVQRLSLADFHLDPTEIERRFADYKAEFSV